MSTNYQSLPVFPPPRVRLYLSLGFWNSGSVFPNPLLGPDQVNENDHREDLARRRVGKFLFVNDCTVQGIIIDILNDTTKRAMEMRE